MSLEALKQDLLEAALRQLDGIKEAIHIVVAGKQWNGARRPLRNRVIAVDMSGKEARDFQISPTFTAIWDVYGAYLGEGVGDDKQAIEVESVTITEREGN